LINTFSEELAVSLLGLEERGFHPEDGVYFSSALKVEVAMFLRNAGTYLSSDVALHTSRLQSFIALRDLLTKWGVAHIAFLNSEGPQPSVPALQNNRSSNLMPISICMTVFFFTWCRSIAGMLVQRSKGDGQAGRHAWPLMAAEECVGMVWNVNERSRI
jgi:hypothetical protein